MHTSTSDFGFVTKRLNTVSFGIADAFICDAALQECLVASIKSISVQSLGAAMAAPRLPLMCLSTTTRCFDAAPPASGLPSFLFRFLVFLLFFFLLFGWLLRLRLWDLPVSRRRQCCDPSTKINRVNLTFPAWCIIPASAPAPLFASAPTRFPTFAFCLARRLTFAAASFSMPTP